MYTVYKSVTRTAKENALIKHNNKTLYDFSIFSIIDMIINSRALKEKDNAL